MEYKRIPINIPIVTAEPQADGNPFGSCTDAEPFALMVLGDSMEPEFMEREIIVVEPEGLATDGSYVIAFHNEEYIFRQLIKRETGWALHALNPAYPDHPIASLSGVRGVVIMKKKPGRPSKSGRKYYVGEETH
ncbi:MAG: S24 family peptidase [Azonexus sp.]|jgi:phage repressor protein C with HTH and peptisase S24 domain|nr:S24 family peptidase [Azonexus sp.]